MNEPTLIGLDEKGRCPVCVRKPLKYKTEPHRGYFCSKCDRSYDYDTGLFKPNWAWANFDTRNKPLSESDKGDEE